MTELHYWKDPQWREETHVPLVDQTPQVAMVLTVGHPITGARMLVGEAIIKPGDGEAAKRQLIERANRLAPGGNQT